VTNDEPKATTWDPIMGERRLSDYNATYLIIVIEGYISHSVGEGDPVLNFVFVECSSLCSLLIEVNERDIRELG
jgi:hypothetical protein